jgi:aspartyl protease/uncharacterized protein DUF4124
VIRHYWLMGRRTVVALAFLLLLPVTATAQVYHWDDQEGTRHYTNSPDTVPEPYRSTLDPPPSSSAPVDAVALSPPTLAPPMGTTRIPYTAGNPILVRATIGGTGPLTLILDTGADRTMVAPQALSRLGISTANATRAEIRGVTGVDHADVVQVSSLEIGDAKAGPLRIIAHEADLKADGLLGRDFLEHFTVTIDSREQVVTLVPK